MTKFIKLFALIFGLFALTPQPLAIGASPLAFSTAPFVASSSGGGSIYDGILSGFIDVSMSRRFSYTLPDYDAFRSWSTQAKIWSGIQLFDSSQIAITTYSEQPLGAGTAGLSLAYNNKSGGFGTTQAGTYIYDFNALGFPSSVRYVKVFVETPNYVDTTYFISQVNANATYDTNPPIYTARFSIIEDDILKSSPSSVLKSYYDIFETGNLNYSNVNLASSTPWYLPSGSTTSIGANIGTFNASVSTAYSPGQNTSGMIQSSYQSYTPNDKIYVYISKVSTSTTATSYIGLEFYSSSFALVTQTSTTANRNTVAPYSGITSNASASSVYYKVFFKNSSTPATRTLTMTGPVFIINLTQTFGAGNEPTASVMQGFTENYIKYKGLESLTTSSLQDFYIYSESPFLKGNKAPFPSDPPAPLGYYFSHWSLNPAITNQPFYTYRIPTADDTANDILTLYPIYFLKKTARFVDRENLSSTQIFNTKITIPSDPTRAGYTFQGWYDSSGVKLIESNSFVYDGDSRLEIVDSDGTPYFDNTITYSARWTPNFNGGGGPEIITPNISPNMILFLDQFGLYNTAGLFLVYGIVALILNAIMLSVVKFDAVTYLIINFVLTLIFMFFGMIPLIGIILLFAFYGVAIVGVIKGGPLSL